MHSRTRQERELEQNWEGRRLGQEGRGPGKVRARDHSGDAAFTLSEMRAAARLCAKE